MTERDLLIAGGTIHTLDPALPHAEALAIRGERIVAVGTAGEVRGALRPGYELLDLGGGAALPGLCDSHVHLSLLAQARERVDLERGGDFAATLGRIAAYADGLGSDEWVRGWGWNHELWGGRWPTAADLDGVSGGRPAVLSRKDGHSIWVNSAALLLAGVDARTAAPPGGAIMRDERGEPTGILFENAAQLIWRIVPSPTPGQRQVALLKVLREAQRYGLTSLHLPEAPDCLADLQSLYGRGLLGTRVLYHIPQYRLEEALALGLRSGFGDEWLRIGGVKIFSDGSLGSRTAHMLEPFEGTQDDYGIATLAREELFGMVERAIGGGLAVAVHAIGDAANRGVLDAVEAALRAQPQPVADVGELAALPVLPHRIEHAQIVHPRDIPRFAHLGVVASMQPIHATSDLELADRHWGASRSATAYAWRALHEAGAILAFGSDAPVETFSPWAGIHAAVTRQRPDGTPEGGWYPEQRLSLEEALWAYCVGPALASGELALKGTLSPGKLADIVLLRQDPFALEPGELGQLAPSATLLGGNVVWEG